MYDGSTRIYLHGLSTRRGVSGDVQSVAATRWQKRSSGRQGQHHYDRLSVAAGRTARFVTCAIATECRSSCRRHSFEEENVLQTPKTAGCSPSRRPTDHSVVHVLRTSRAMAVHFSSHQIDQQLELFIQRIDTYRSSGTASQGAMAPSVFKSTRFGPLTFCLRSRN